MKILPPLAALAMTACVSLPADDAAHSLARAETEFAAHSVREDMRVAFMAHFAPDGVFVRNGWVVARTALASQPRPPLVLDWAPRYTEAAASGDFGLSTGPWKLTSRDSPEQPAAYGQFVSIWTRAPGGPWQVLVDLGISHAEPALWDSMPLYRRSPGVAHAESLAHAEADFARLASTRGLREAYRQRGAADLRLYREGEPPRASREASLGSAWLRDAAAGTWTIDAQGGASSGELGYARGMLGAADGKPLGWWMRVWRREAHGWRIALDVMTPAKG
jgi:ketosteroid isomerase-like protein